METKKALAFINDKIKIMDYFNTHVVPVAKRAKDVTTGNETMLCPFHVDSDPSLKFYSKSNSFFCFGGCGGGGVVQMHMKLRKLRDREVVGLEKAISEVAKLYNLIQDIGELEKNKLSVFQQCRLKMGESTKVNLEGTLANVLKRRKRIDEMEDLTLENRASLYAEVDLMATALYADRED